jgi:hypothetical protein
LTFTLATQISISADHPVPSSPRRRRSCSRSKSRSDFRPISESDTDADNSSKIDQTDSVANHINGENSAVAMETDVEPSVELKTELLNFIQEKLYSRYVMTMTDVKRLFAIKLGQCPPGHVLGSGVADKLMEQSIVEVGGVKLQNQVMNISDPILNPGYSPFLNFSAVTSCDVEQVAFLGFALICTNKAGEQNHLGAGHLFHHYHERTNHSFGGRGSDSAYVFRIIKNYNLFLK